MQCPICLSQEVQIMDLDWQTYLQQVYCSSCEHQGTYYDFGLDKDQNTGLATFCEGAEYSLEHEICDPSDQSSKIAITVHQVGKRSACNTWVMRYGQWLKYQPERVSNIIPSPGLLQGELIRLMLDEEEKLASDYLVSVAVMGLQNMLTYMISQPDSDTAPGKKIKDLRLETKGGKFFFRKKKRQL